MPTDQTSGVFNELLARVNALEAWRTHQTDLIDEVLHNRRLADDAGDEIDELVAEDLDETIDEDRLIEWVHLCVAGVIARPLRGEYAWCPRWWDHAEAVFRFAALHRAWIELAPEPGAAMSIWIRDHLDPCLQQLLSPSGPFADCTHSERMRALHPEHTPLPTLPTAQPSDR